MNLTCFMLLPSCCFRIITMKMICSSTLSLCAHSAVCKSCMKTQLCQIVLKCCFWLSRSDKWSRWWRKANVCLSMSPDHSVSWFSLWGKWSYKGGCYPTTRYPIKFSILMFSVLVLWYFLYYSVVCVFLYFVLWCFLY